MIDDRGSQIRDAEPSMPVEVLGLDALPEAGDSFQVVTDTAKAKQIVMYREAKARESALAKNSRLTLEQLHKQMQAGEVKELPIILKADVAGSAEVLTDTLQKLSNDKVRVRVLHSGVGAITEYDVLLASTSNAIIVGFNVRPERNAAAVAEQEKVDIRLHTIIYNLTDEIKRAMTGILEPVYREVYKGKAEVRDTFRVTKVGMVAGCFVQDGTITRDSEVRLLRDNVVVFTGKIGSLRRFKDDVSEVKSGMECGITIENFGDIKQGDVIEAFVTERVATEVFA
jgi:translation initiation factor IF-2